LHSLIKEAVVTAAKKEEPKEHKRADRDLSASPQRDSPDRDSVSSSSSSSRTVSSRDKESSSSKSSSRDKKRTSADREADKRASSSSPSPPRPYSKKDSGSSLHKSTSGKSLTHIREEEEGEMRESEVQPSPDKSPDAPRVSAADTGFDSASSDDDDMIDEKKEAELQKQLQQQRNINSIKALFGGKKAAGDKEDEKISNDEKAAAKPSHVYVFALILRISLIRKNNNKHTQITASKHTPNNNNPSINQLCFCFFRYMNVSSDNESAFFFITIFSCACCSPALMGCRSVFSYKKVHKIDEGTYGIVYRAINTETGETVALKKIKMDKSHASHTFPVTSLREINILLVCPIIFLLLLLSTSKKKT